MHSREYLVLASPPSQYNNLRVLKLLDRKSTRLNSSHLVISYAVFCLKKKKKKHKRLLKRSNQISVALKCVIGGKRCDYMAGQVRAVSSDQAVTYCGRMVR